MASKQKKLQGEFYALRAFLEARFNELKAELGKLMRTPPPKPVATPKPASARTSRNHDALAQALQNHKRAKDLIRVGKKPDQLLRSLIPLYVARGVAGIQVNSGAISAFWKQQGVRYAGPNAAKALRRHVGYANPAKVGKGWEITPTGVKYVEAALAKKMAA